MPENLNEAVLTVMGWFFVITCVGSYIVYHVARIRRANLDHFEQAWQRRFEPNRPNVPEAPQWNDAQPSLLDHEYLRLMEHLPDDHLPADWRQWGDKAGTRR